LDPDFDPSACPQVAFFDWWKTGDARCAWQGPQNAQENRLDCDGPGQVDVWARAAGFENIVGHSIFKVQG
jgi:hypothetical protein